MRVGDANWDLDAAGVRVCDAGRLALRLLVRERVLVGETGIGDLDGAGVVVRAAVARAEVVTAGVRECTTLG